MNEENENVSVSSKAPQKTPQKAPKKANREPRKKKRSSLYLTLLVGAVVIGLAFTIIKFFGTERVKRNASISIEFTYEGAAQNLTPDGEQFSINDIFADSIIEIALASEDLLDKYSPETIKFALLSTNYRADINVTESLFPDAEKHLADFYAVFRAAADKGVALSGENKAIDDAFNLAMDDDFNTALALSYLFGLFKAARAKLAAGDKSVGADLNQIKNTYSLLGLFQEDAAEFLKNVEAKAANETEIPEEIVALAEERSAARKNKDWAKSDELRNAIAALGYEIKDSKDGYTLSKK